MSKVNFAVLSGIALLQSASYLAQKGATGKTKKDNLEYAKAAWERISEKYEVGTTQLSAVCNF